MQHNSHRMAPRLLRPLHPTQARMAPKVARRSPRVSPGTCYTCAMWPFPRFACFTSNVCNVVVVAWLLGPPNARAFDN
eukprot:9046027-Alexandrium_andersonii.AAC.1